MSLDLDGIMDSIVKSIEEAAINQMKKSKAKPSKPKKPKKSKKSKRKTKRKSKAINIEEMNWKDIPDNFKLITTEQQCEEISKTFIKHKDGYKYIVIDTETTGGTPHETDCVGIVVYNPLTDVSAYFPFKHRYPDTKELRPNQLSYEVFSKYFKELLEDVNTRVINQNIKYDDHVLYYNTGINIANPYFDTLVAANVLDENVNHGLKDMANLYLNKNVKTFEDYFGKPQYFQYAPLSTALYYTGLDGKLPWEMYQFQNKHLSMKKHKNLNYVFWNIEMPLVKPLAEIERYGMNIDLQVAKELKKEYEKELNELYPKMTKIISELDIDINKVNEEIEKYEWTKKLKDKKEKERFKTEIELYKYNCFLKDIHDNPESINYNSSKQMKWLFYEILNLPIVKHKGTVTTGQKAREQLKGMHPIIDLLEKYSKTEKLYRDFVLKLPTVLHPKTNKIHATFNQYGAKTGRFSCKEPNLQQIPKRGDHRPRTMFKASEGYYLVSNDYSQMELRILAHESGDPALMKAYCGILTDHEGQPILDKYGDTVIFNIDNWIQYIDMKYRYTYTEFIGDKPIIPEHLKERHVKTLDIHTFTASQIFNVPYEEVTKEQRTVAKNINFGLMYGMSDKSLSKNLKISKELARQYIDTYFQRFSKVKEWIENTKQFARDNGYVTTLFGRKRRLPWIYDSNKWTRFSAEREAINAPIQGGNADITKIAIVRIHTDKKCKELGVKVLSTIHDEILWEVPKENIKEAMERVIYLMTDFDLKVPIVSDSDIFVHWMKNIPHDQISELQ